MPIQFCCSHCHQMLSISTRRAGTLIVCPACTEEIRVPGEVDVSPASPVNLNVAARSKSTDQSRHPASGSEARPKSQSIPETVQELSVVSRSRPAKTAYATGTTGSSQPFLDEQDEDEHEQHPPHKKKKFMDDTVDMTAMVDVTFLLLIFFMVTASFAAQKVFETSPPEQESEGAGGAQASSVEDLESNSVIVEIDSSDRIEIEGQPISGLFQLRETLASKITLEGKTDVLIQAQYEATHGMVVSVTDVAMDAGMQNVRRISRRVDD